MMKVGVITLGCPKNVVDSELIISSLLEEDIEVVSELSELWEADAIVINTCGFLRAAIEELLDTAETVAQLIGDKPAIVVGCAVNRLREDPDGLLRGLRETGLNVRALLTSANLLELPKYLREVLTESKMLVDLREGQPNYEGKRRSVLSSPFWAYLKIAEGCSHKCGFCTIPQIRGPYRSRSMEDILSEAESLAEMGIRELILISQDTTYWGTDLYGKPRITELLRELSELPFKWIRLMYLMPTGITDELIEAMVSLPNVLPYFDIPFQHISERVLRAMRRAPLPELHYQLVERIRASHGVIRATFIVGHPGEEEEDFLKLLEFIRWGKFERIGLFAYSPEPETHSAKLPQVPEEVKEERYAHAISEAQALLREWMRGRVGELHEVLVESLNIKSRYRLLGRSWFDAPEVDGVVRVRGEGAPGDVLKVRIIKFNSRDATFWGEVVP